MLTVMSNSQSSQRIGCIFHTPPRREVDNLLAAMQRTSDPDHRNCASNSNHGDNLWITDCALVHLYVYTASKEAASVLGAGHTPSCSTRCAIQKELHTQHEHCLYTSVLSAIGGEKVLNRIRKIYGCTS